MSIFRLVIGIFCLLFLIILFRSIKSKKSKLIFLNLLVVLVLLYTLIILTSRYESLPWYESCGLQFLTIPIVCMPVLFVIGLALLKVSKSYHISKLNKLIPFIAIGGFIVLLFIPGDASILLIVGLALLALFAIIETITIFISKKE